MGLLTNIGKALGGASGEAVKETLNGVGDAAIKIRTAITGDLPPNIKAEVELHLADLDNALQLAQAKINEIEASSDSLFKSGWRPAIGWVCAISLAVYYIPRFALGTGLWFWASLNARTLQTMPEMGIQDIIGLVLSLIGVGIMRSYDKKAGTA